MKGWAKQLKYRFYRQDITKRIIIVITMLSILSNTVFVGSVFVIMKNQLFNKTKLDHEKDITMLEKELEMFFKGIRNDAVSVLVSDSCQTLLSDSEEFLSANTATQYRKYKLMQGTIMSTIGQRPEYNTITFYDLKGNCYGDERLIESQGYLKAQQERIREFLASGENEMVTCLHKSPWRKSISCLTKGLERSKTPRFMARLILRLRITRRRLQCTPLQRMQQPDWRCFTQGTGYMKT